MTENFFPDDEPQFAPSPAPPKSAGTVKNFFPEEGEPDTLPVEKPRKPVVPGVLANNEDDSGWLSAAKGTGTAIIKGLANIPGAVKNNANLVDYLMARGHAAVTGRPLEEVQRDLQQRYATASQGASNLTGGVFKAPENVLPSGEDIAAPVLKKTGEYQPSTGWGRVGMAGVETAAGMVGPGGGARVVNAPIKATGLVPRIAETAIAPAVKAAPMNVVAGAAAQSATEATGDPLAGLAAGVVAPAVASIPAKIVKPVVRPFLPSGREVGVGEQILKTSENPEALRQKLEQAGSTQTIPGSQPTLAQWVGTDQGLHNAEMAARNEATGPNDPFAAVDKAQNTARLQALEQGAPAGADTMDVPTRFQARLDHIDQSTEAAVNRLTQDAEAAAPKGTQEPETVGDTFRTAVEGAKKAEKELYGHAYDVIDPEKKLNVVALSGRDAANQVVDSITEWTPPIENKDLRRILPKMQEMPDVMPLRHLGELDKDVTSAMFTERRQNGQSPDLARLTQLKVAIKGAINDAVANQEKYEAGAVARGEMHPGDTMASRVRGLWQDEQVSADRQRSNAATGTAGAGAGAGRPAGVGAGPAIGGLGANGEGGRGLPASAGDQGISSSEPLTPNVDQAAAARVNAAKAAYTNYAQTYKSEPVASALKTTGAASDYKMQASALPAKIFVNGDKGYETTSAFLKAAKDAPEAVEAIKDYTRSTLAKAAVKDGTLDPAGHAKWQQAHKGSLRAIEERSPGFTQELSDPAAATDKMLTAQAARKQELGNFQKSQAGAFLGKSTPMEVENTIGHILQKKDISSIEQLIKQASTDPAVLDGLRKAGTDWMAREFTNESGEKWMKSAKFRDFVNNRYDALARLYPPDQVNMFRAIADDLALADRPAKATAPKRGPGTAKDVAPLLKKAVEAAKHTSLFNAMAVGAMGGFELNGLKGAMLSAAGTGAAYAFGTWRAAGVRTMQDMFRDALSSPERARIYVSKVPQERALSAVTRSLRRELLLAKPIGIGDDRTNRASGGRVNTRDYPAKKASALEKQANRIRKAYGGELNPLLGVDDNVVARALRLAQH